MHELERIVWATALAGACIPLGGILARVERIRPRWLENELRHFIIALSGGILLAAVTFVLVPEGIRFVVSPTYSAVACLLGGISFFLVERYLGLRRRERPQFAVMLLDYIPESLALGGVFAAGSDAAPMLAVLIGLQNLPEGFNAYRELAAVPETNRRRLMFHMWALVPMGPLLGIVGWSAFAENTELLGTIMLFAAGGILYLIFQDIAPQSRLRRNWAPPLGAVIGFSAGMFGQMWFG